MATATQRARLRADLDATATTFPDSEVDDIFVQAGESYTDGSSIEAYARIIAIRRLLASAAKRVSYKQNQSSENQSDIFKALKQLLQLWTEELTVAVGGVTGAVRLGGVRRKPSYVREYPNG